MKTPPKMLTREMTLKLRWKICDIAVTSAGAGKPAPHGPHAPVNMLSE
jgi:hypothetical protein